MRFLHIIVIHAKHLTYRKKFILDTLKIIQQVSASKSYVYSVHFVQEYEMDEVRSKIKDIEKDIVLIKTEDAEFDNSMKNTLTGEQVSNFLKQRTAIEKIIDLEQYEKEGDKHYYLILEDDCTIVPEFIRNIEIFLENPEPTKWDILFLCLSNSNDSSTNYKFKDTRTFVKVLPSKEAYCITPYIAKRMLPAFSKINFTYRFQLSHWIHTNKDVLSMYNCMRVSLEGSKIGIHPSTVCENNMPIYNGDFIALFNMLTNKEPSNMKTATKHYNNAEHLGCAEIMHIYAVILHKNDKNVEASSIMEKAIDIMVSKSGLLTRRSELLNNAINIYGMCQEEEIKEYQSKPSKYAPYI